MRCWWVLAKCRQARLRKATNQVNQNPGRRTSDQGAATPVRPQSWGDTGKCFAITRWLFIGYGKADFGSRLNPSLITVRQQPYPVGLVAATLVIPQIEAVNPAHGLKVSASTVVGAGRSWLPT
jgi:hypothetical protein